MSNTCAAELVDRLARDGLLRQEGKEHRTTRRWQSAMARAATMLAGAVRDGGVPFDDVRLPITIALLELYPEIEDDEALAALVETLVPIEARELAPLTGVGPGA